MRKFILLPLLLWQVVASSQNYSMYKKTTVMIPMRDGIKLFTTIYAPVKITGQLPIIFQRTPYGVPKRDSINFSNAPYYAAMVKEGYLFAFQDIRGKFGSEGQMEMDRPMYHQSNPRAVDEST